MDTKYDALFRPWKVGNVEIKKPQRPMGGTSLFGWLERTGCKIDGIGGDERRNAMASAAAFFMYVGIPVSARRPSWTGLLRSR